MAGNGAVKQATIALGIKQALLIKASFLETMAHIGSENKIIFAVYYLQQCFINWTGMEISL